MDERTFGRALRGTQAMRGWTQETLAERADLAVDTITRLERGRFSPTLGTLNKLATALGVGLPDLLTGPAQDGLTAAERGFIDAVAVLLIERRPHEAR